MPSNKINDKIKDLPEILTTLGYQTKVSPDKDNSVYGWAVYPSHTNRLVRWYLRQGEPVAFVAMKDEDEVRIGRHPNPTGKTKELIETLKGIFNTRYNFQIVEINWDKK